jgi:ParB-like chromosome segregation protein Spo0J
MKIELIKTDKLVPYARNAKKHDETQVAKLAGSIREFGFNNPVLIDKDNGIIAGHGRVMAAQKLELKDVPCIRLGHLTDTQRRAYILADNRLAEIGGGWDEEMMALELGDLRELDFDLNLIGLNADKIEAILNPLEPDFAPGTEDDQGKLDQLEPKLVKCPHCQSTFDSRGHEQS